jgi:hypothetical protein
MMFRYSKLATVFALFVLAVSISASAGSNNSFSNVNLTGISGTVSGQFSFDSTKDSFSGLSLTFNGGIFNGVNASNGGGKGNCLFGLCQYTWQKQMNSGAWVWETIVFNLKTGQFQDFGGIYKGKYNGGFNYMSVPEGETPLSYLILSGFAMLAGIAVASKRRRAARIAECS